MKLLYCLPTLVLVAAPALAEETSNEAAACLRAKSINGWAHGNSQIARLDTAGKRWRVTFKQPCLNNRDRPLGLRFGIRVGTYCVEPGDELVFVTSGGYEQFCIVATIEQIKLGEELVPETPAETDETE